LRLVDITDRGRPAHVLLSFDAYEEFVAAKNTDAALPADSE
jgi:PHD/YefM family antitoxin component YafN of YafNO toxin-antitoxin module